MKVCLIANIAPHYREDIYRLIDMSLDCDFVFGDTLNNGIRTMDLTGFRNRVNVLKNIQNGEVTMWQKGVLKTLAGKYDAYIVSGDIRCISTWTFLALSALLGRKVWLWTHGWTGREKWLVRQMKKLFYSFADGLFLYGDYAKGLMTAEGFVPERLRVIHNSLAHDRQVRIRESLTETAIYREHFCNQDPTLIFIGRLTHSKRLDMVLDAMMILQGRGVFCNLVLVGSGAEAESLRRKAVDDGLEGRVWFYGACYDESRNAELIYNADLCVSPGNIGLTAIHVLTYGTPALTHNQFRCQGPEFEALRPKVTGDFYEYGNVGSMADRIEAWLLESKVSRTGIRLSCYNEIDRYWTPEYQMNVILETLSEYACTPSD